MSNSDPSSARQTKCHAPPGRRSTSHTGIAQPGGPSIHFVMCSGLVQQSKTSARGASTTRVTSISVSDGVANPVAPSLLAVVIVELLLLEVAEVVVEPLVARVPEAAVVLGPFGDLLERRRLEAGPPPPCFPAAH